MKKESNIEREKTIFIIINFGIILINLIIIFWLEYLMCATSTRFCMYRLNIFFFFFFLHKDM